MKRRNPRVLVLACAVLALLVVPCAATAAGPGLVTSLHSEDDGGSVSDWLDQLRSSFWGVLTYDAPKRSVEIEKLGQQLDPNGHRRFERTQIDHGNEPQDTTQGTGGS